MRLLFKGFALDLLANAVVLAVLNTAFAVCCLTGWIVCAALAHAIPELSVILIAILLALSIAVTGPVGDLLCRVARQEDLRDAATLLSSIRARFLLALGGLGIVSAFTAIFWSTSDLSGAAPVAFGVFAIWGGFVAAQITLFAIAIAQHDVDPSTALRSAVLLAFRRPVYSAVVVAGFLLCLVSVVILIPGPAGGAMLVQRAVRNVGDLIHGAELEREERRVASQSLLSALFPWKA